VLSCAALHLLALHPTNVQVPFLVDGDLRLPESAAIMACLCDKYNLPDAWHPSSSSSSSSRAVYESAVHWQHLNMRLGCMKLVFHTVIGKRVCCEQHLRLTHPK
jgi:glutathione S-transferase